MKVIISPSELSGVLQAPASKSSMQRACAAALLRKGRTVIHSPGHSNDDKAAIDIIQKLGACVEHSTDALEVTSDGVNPVSLEVNCGESGLSIRMFTPIAALSTLPVRINGSGSLVQRPMDFLIRYYHNWVYASAVMPDVCQWIYRGRYKLRILL